MGSHGRPWSSNTSITSLFVTHNRNRYSKFDALPGEKVLDFPVASVFVTVSTWTDVTCDLFWTKQE